MLRLGKENLLTKDVVQQRGTVDHTPLYPREIAKRALELGASALIMVHHHPSGDPTPSCADIETTKKVTAALNPIRVVRHDHLIMSETRLQKRRAGGVTTSLGFGDAFEEGVCGSDGMRPFVGIALGFFRDELVINV